jgi:hypothetical protein
LSISSKASRSSASILLCSSPRSALVSISSKSPKVDARERFEDRADECVEEVCPADDVGDGGYPKISTGDNAPMSRGAAGRKKALLTDDTAGSTRLGMERRFCA